mgnify:CR=1 FL=1
MLAYYKIIKKHSAAEQELYFLQNKNNRLVDKISRLSPNTLDLDYLDEKIRLNTGKISENELVIIFDN